MSITAITHCDYNGLIGLNGELAYKSAEDFKEFKKLTISAATILVMGTKTYAEAGKLPGRKTLVLSSKGNKLDRAPTGKTVELLAKTNKLFLCGGAGVYSQYLELCSEVIVHYTKQKKPLFCKTDISVYFPLDYLYKDFKPACVIEFNSFTQVWFIKI